jgi:predicted dehydrogenase
MGGGVGIDLIHEWDYLTAFFGMPKKSFSIQEKISALEIDSDDIAIYIAKTETTTIELHLDYFGRKTIRTLDLFMPEDTIHCDILNGHIEYLKSGKQFDFNSERNVSQMLEIEHFFDIINNKITNDNTLEHSLNVLKLAKR